MANSQKNNMLINLISDRPANVAKALRVGRVFLDGGWEVTLSLNVDGVQVVNKAAELGPCPVTGKPLLQLLEAFLGEGGRGLVGKECMTLAGLEPEALLPGLEIAAFPLMEELLATPEIKILTW